MIPLFKYFKSNTDFRIEFFFSGEVVADNEDEIRNMLMNYSKFSTKKPKFEENLNNTKTIETEIQILSPLIMAETYDKLGKHDNYYNKPIDYPIFFKQFKCEKNYEFTSDENSLS